MKTLTIIFENGKTLKYHGNKLELLTYKMRIEENIIKRKNLGMTINKVLEYKITECEY